MATVITIAGQTALVTGAARRLGAATALALAKAGVHVVVHYGSSAKDAESVAADVRTHGVNAWTLQADLCQSCNAERVLDAALTLAGPIDILVNNASTFHEGSLRDCSTADIESNVQMNALTPLLLGRRLAGQERAGCIINLLDTMIADYDRKHVPYHLSKRLLHSLTRMMAVEFAPLLRVNAVAPGLILPPEGKDERYLAALAHSNPLQSYGDAVCVTDAILFLLRSQFITGQTIFVDGGRNLRGRMYD